MRQTIIPNLNNLEQPSPLFLFVSRSVSLVDRRFGPPSDRVRERATQADPNTLLHWSERILHANSLEEVLY